MRGAGGAGARGCGSQTCFACATSRRAPRLRAAGVRAEILVFGALSVSDLDGVFDCRLTPTISSPGRPEPWPRRRRATGSGSAIT